MDWAQLLPSIQIELSDIMDPNATDTAVARPAHALVVQHLPRLDASTSSDPCPICMESDDHQAWTVLQPCGHCLHHGCCVRWLRQHRTCPLCRSEVQLNTDRLTTRQLLDMHTQLGIERDETVVERQDLIDRIHREISSA